MAAKGVKGKKPTVKPKRRPGAPSMYSPALVKKICAHIADGKSLRAIQVLAGMPTMTTMMAWLDGGHPEFSEQYARARTAQADKMAEDILAIADDGHNDTYFDDEGNVRTDHDVIARSRLRVDARKWLASKLAPKKYGEKLAVGGDADAPPIRHDVNLSPADAYKAILGG